MAAPGAGSSRLPAIDLLRGFIMVVMAWDHVKDGTAEFMGMDNTKPGDPPFQRNNHTHSPAWYGTEEAYSGSWGWFLARAVSHICAPGFSYLMGIGMVLLTAARMDEHRMRRSYNALPWTRGAVLRFFMLRGLLIIALGFAVRTAETLRLIDPPPDAKSFIGYETGFFQVMTCLGLQMIVAAPLVCQIVSSIQTSRAVAANGANAPLLVGGAEYADALLEKSPATQRRESEQYHETVAARGALAAQHEAWQVILLLLGLTSFIVTNAVVEAHWVDGAPPVYGNATHFAPPHSTSPLDIAMRFVVLPGPFNDGKSRDLYPLFGWLGFCLWGVAAGLDFWLKPAKAEKRTKVAGIALLVCFLLVRGCFGRYGNLRGWPIGEGGNSTAAKSIAFFNVCKYPPSLAYALITLGVVQLLLVGLRKMAAADQAVAARAAALAPVAQGEGATVGADGAKLASRGWLSPGHPSSPAQGQVQPQGIGRFWSILRARALVVLLAYGRSPLFFYMAHFPLIVILEVIAYAAQGSPPDRKGVPIWVSFLLWLCVVLPVMYAATRRYGQFKATTGPNSLWRFL